MSNINNTTSVLNHLSPEAQAQVRAEVRAEIAHELAGGVVSTPAPAPAPRAAKAGTAKKPGRKPSVETSENVQVQGSGRGQRQSNEQYASASEFIRSLPLDMKAREVIDLGAEQGFTISNALVSNTRRRVMETEGNPPAKRGRKPKAETASKAETSEEESKESQGPRQKTATGLSAAAFVRELDEKREAEGKEQLSAKEVVERGHKAGLTNMKEHTVHNTRKNVRKKAAEAAAEATASTRAKKAAETRAANKAKKPAGKKNSKKES